MHWGHVAHLPNGLASTVDVAPCALRLDAAPNQLLGYCASALPLLELNRAQPASDVRIQVMQCSLDLDRADSEETYPPDEILVDPGNTRFERVSPVTRRKLSDFTVDAFLGALRQVHFHVSVHWSSPQTEAEKVSLFGTGHGAFLCIHFQAQAPFDEARNARHDSLPSSFTADVDVTIIRIADESVTALFELPIELVKHNITE